MLSSALQDDSQPSPLDAAEIPFLAERVERYYRERAVNPVTGGHILKGRVPAAGDILLTSNDYLSLARHPEIIEAQRRVLRDEGHGLPRSSVFDFGDTPLRRLEREIAAAAQAEDAIVTQSGWCANTGLLQSIASPESPVYIDMFAHMSLWEGVKSAGAPARPFRHNSVESLRKLIAKYGPGVVVVDSLYSTNGDVCPLRDIVETAREGGCVIVVDEAHSLGVYGARGEGMVAELGLAGEVHFRTASLSKAYAARGGLILCSARHAEYLRYASLPAIFSSGLLAHEIAGLRATVRVIGRERFRREKLLRNAAALRARLHALGYDVGRDATQIIALVPGAEHLTIQLRDALEARGVFGSVFCDPATPRNRSLVRFTLNADLCAEDLERIAAVCDAVRGAVDIDQWPQSRPRQAQPLAA
ncbi:MAG: alpha-hydroxyketone-type quorum-sensing autoinducer synthase [Burkholderiales bacterium]|nr:alpha-hydroxyketone-type quorum-sensing autoinducer synthase [Burkholderiales bacterium]